MLHCPPQVQTYYYNKTTTVTCFIFFVVFHIVFNFSKILHTASLRNNYLALQLFGSSTRIRQYYNNKKSLVFLFLSVYHHHNQKKRNFLHFLYASVVNWPYIKMMRGVYCFYTKYPSTTCL